MITPVVAGLTDDAVYVDVEITPLPTPPPSPLPSPSPWQSQLPDHGWLAVTGFEPAWMVVGGAILLLVVGVTLAVSGRRRTRPPAS